jgi:hypothetical protein
MAEKAIKKKPWEIQSVDLMGAIASLAVALWTIWQIYKNDKND